MNAADIIKQYGRGVPAIVQSAKIVHVCEYMLSCHVPGTVILSEYGEVKGTLSQNDIINASGRLGSAVLRSRWLPWPSGSTGEGTRRQ